MKKPLLILIFLLAGVSGLAQENEFVLPDSISGLLKEHRNIDTKRAEALNAAILYCYNTAISQNRNLLDEGMCYIKELDKLANDIKDRYWIAYTEYYYGLYALEKYDYESCILQMKKALHIVETLSKSCDVEMLHANIYVTLSGCYVDWNMLPEAYECVENGLEIAKKWDFNNMRIVLMSNKGVVLYKMGRYQECIDVYSMICSDKINYSWLVNIALAYSELKKYDSCIVYCDSIIDGGYRIIDVILAQNLKGDCCMATNRMCEAEKSYFKALELSNKYNDLNLKGDSYWYISEFYVKKQMYEIAVSYVDSAKYCFTECKDSRKLGICYKLSADILQSVGDFETAYKNINLFMHIKDSLEEVQNTQKVDEMAFQKEMKNMDAEYQAGKKLSHQRVVYSFLIAIIVVVLSAVIIILLIKNKKKKEALLSNELEYRNREITAKAMLKMKSNEVIDEVIKKLRDIDGEIKDSKHISSIIRDLKNISDDDSKNDFDVHFVQIHPDFYANLLKDFPKLTQNELRLCAFIKSNLSIKEIAAINNLSADSVKTARKRLRKSLQLTGEDTTLTEFLSKY